MGKSPVNSGGGNSRPSSRKELPISSTEISSSSRKRSRTPNSPDNGRQSHRRRHSDRFRGKDRDHHYNTSSGDRRRRYSSGGGGSRRHSPSRRRLTSMNS